jgi:hypothetical protein
MSSSRSLPLALAALVLGATAGGASAQSVVVRGTFNGIPFPPLCAPPPAQSVLFSLTPPPARLQAQFACNTAPTALQFTCLPSQIASGVSASYGVRSSAGVASELLVECPTDASTEVGNLEISILDLFADRATYEADPGANAPARACLSAAGQSVSRASYDPATRILSFDCVDGGVTTSTQCFTFDGIPVSSAQSTSGMTYPTTGSPAQNTNVLTIADCIGFGTPANQALNSPALVPAGSGTPDPDLVLRDGFEPPNSVETTTSIASITPNPATIGEPYTVNVQVDAPTGRPSGAVLVSDGVGANCTATLVPDAGVASRANATCQLTSQTAGTRTVRATYAGRVGFDGSTATRAQDVGIGNQVISFTSPAEGASVTYSPSGTVPLVATGGNSGNPVVFASTTPATCTVAASAATIVAAGTCTVTANQAGNANYNPAPQVTRNFTIAKADQVITFPDPGPQPYGQTFQVSATGGASGMPVVFESTDNLKCRIDPIGSNIVVPVAVGVCTIRAYQAGNDNYNGATPVLRQITITRGNGSLDFPAQGPFALAGGNFTLQFTPGPSTGQVTFVSLTPNICTRVSGATFQPIATGTCIVAATHEEDAFYNASPTIKQNIVIN